MCVVGLVGVVGLVDNNDESKFAQFSLHNTAAECDFLICPTIQRE